MKLVRVGPRGQERPCMATNSAGTKLETASATPDSRSEGGLVHAGLSECVPSVTVPSAD